MYRADLSRTLTLVVALLLMVAPTGVFARGFRAADTRHEDCPTVQALRFMGRLVAERSGGARVEAGGVTIVKEFDRKPFEEAMTPLCDKALSDPRAAALIERVRKVE